MCVWKHNNILRDEGSGIGKVNTVREHGIAKNPPFSGSDIILSSVPVLDEKLSWINTRGFLRTTL